MWTSTYPRVRSPHSSATTERARPCSSSAWPGSGLRRVGRSSGTVEEVHIHSPRDAEALGIATVYQDLALCDNLDIVQNMYLGHEETRFSMLDEIKMELATKKTLSDLSVSTVKSVRQLVGSLSGGQRQAIAVTRAVMRDSKLVIMDEPTAALGVSQTAQVLDLVRTLADRGHRGHPHLAQPQRRLQRGGPNRRHAPGRTLVSHGPIVELRHRERGRADHDRRVTAAHRPRRPSPPVAEGDPDVSMPPSERASP